MKNTILIILILVSCLLFDSVTIFGDDDLLVLKGTINEDEQIETTAGEVYEVIESPKIQDLSIYKGKRIEVRGKIVEQSETPAFMIFEFKLVKKPVLQEDNKSRRE